ncbi:TPA: hypothetical protein ACH3X1_002692 [Trebouxia sp. C0004]
MPYLLPVFFRDPSMAMSKQSYYDMSTMLLKVAATMPDAPVKTKVQHRHKVCDTNCTFQSIDTLQVRSFCTIVARVAHTEIVGITDNIVFGINYSKHGFVSRQQSLSRQSV